ncbi:LLM class flavin-dependent oxidoreductase [Nonomuraea rubra]|uniref:LLM class flavin-dependent oxidoreductase n=1 Tax=Nonomuraea rubra TaxID=46180 RepID=UPI0033CE785D
MRPPLGLIEYLDLAGMAAARPIQRVAFEAALLADDLGYRRVWVPEHHGVGSPSRSPLHTVAVLGSHTSGIRVGTAVTLLRLRDLYLTAEDLFTVAGFCGDRLDVGLGRGTVGPNSDLLRHLLKDDDALDGDVRELARILRDGCELVEPLGSPYELWLHGTSGRSAVMAAELGASYCHALFLKPDLDVCLRAMDDYRAGASPGTTAVALAVAANTDPARALADARRQPFAVTAGSPEDCAATVLNALRMSGADEVVIAETSSDPDDHFRALKEIHAIVSAATTGQAVATAGLER